MYEEASDSESFSESEGSQHASGGRKKSKNGKSKNGERIRATTACDGCSKRRSKCDGTGPGSACSRCLRTGLECIYTRKMKKRGPQKGSVHAGPKRAKVEHNAAPSSEPPVPKASSFSSSRPRSARLPPPLHIEHEQMDTSSGYSAGVSIPSVAIHEPTDPHYGYQRHAHERSHSPYYSSGEYPSAPSPPLPAFQGGTSTWLPPPLSPSGYPQPLSPGGYHPNAPSPSYSDHNSPFPPPPPPALSSASTGGIRSDLFPRYENPTAYPVLNALASQSGSNLSRIETPNATDGARSGGQDSAVKAGTPEGVASIKVEPTESTAAASNGQPAQDNTVAIPAGLSPFDSLPPMPPQECLNELVSLYFEHAHNYQRIMHKHTVLRTFSTIPPLLQLSIYAAAAMFSQDSRVNAMNLYNRAKMQYKMEMDRPSHFQTVQALLLIIMACVRVGAGSQAVFWAGCALQMVRHLHLFADPDLPARLSVPRGFVSFQDRGKMTWIEKEAERRTFWACVMTDRLSATAINSFCTIKEDDVFVALPCHDLLWDSDLPADLEVDPTGIPISVLLNDPEMGAPAAPPPASAFGRRNSESESVIRYTPGITQPVGPFGHTAKLYLLFGKLLDHRVRCRNRNLSHLADPDISVALHGLRSQLPSWVIELDDTGLPGIPKLGEDIRWGYSYLIMYHYMISVLFGPGEFRDWVGEKFFSEEAGLLWVASSMMTKCLDSMIRVGKMLAGLLARSEDPHILDLGGPFLPYCIFQPGMVGLVAMRAASLGIIDSAMTTEKLKATVEILIWGLQKHGKTNRTCLRLATHLNKLLSDVGEFNGQFPAVSMVERMQQRKQEFLEDMEASNPFRAAYHAELTESTQPSGMQRVQSYSTSHGSEAVSTPPRPADLTHETPGIDSGGAAVLNMSLVGAHQAKVPTGQKSVAYMQVLQTQGIGGIVGNSDLDRLLNESAHAAVSTSKAFINARSY